MVPAILGKKVGMTQVFGPAGERMPVTIVEAGPCVVLQVKAADAADGYHAVQLGFEDVKPHRSTLPAIGHSRKAQTSPKRFIREIRLSDATDRKVGDVVTVDIFKDAGVKYVDVVGISKGKGFQGAMKRYGFGGQPGSHGTERKHRSPGSIGAHAQNRGTSGAIKKGKRMSGHMGSDRQTIRNQAIVGMDAENNVLWIRGAIPGPPGGYVVIRKSKTRSE
ncbi:MAG: 50S ribosomal protein L3 [Phycisphaerales bacterium]|nr:50S ribosomal protein L3 [Phycisphaerales bacterium]